MLMLVYELLQLEETKKIKGHTKREMNLLYMNIETNLDNLKLELRQLQEIYKTLDSNITNYLNNQILITCFYMEENYIKRLYIRYKDTDIISNNRELIEVTNEFVTISKELKTVIDKIIKRLEKEARANSKQMDFINSIKKSRYYNTEP